MAWNQPGGQNNNPWGSRRPNNGSGGPNLDERMKDWQRRFESLFRPGGKGEGGALFITVLLLILTLWLFSGFFQVKAAERGVIQRFGKVVLPVRAEGWGWRFPWPIEQVTEVNTSLKDRPDHVNSKPHETWMVKVKLANPAEAAALMDTAAYEQLIQK